MPNKRFGILTVAAILSTILLPTVAQAASPGWVVEVLGSEAWATGEKLRLPLVRSGLGEPDVLGWERPPGAHPQIRLLRYVAGEQGTSLKMLEVRGLIYSLSLKKILADETLAYVDPVTPSRKVGAQPSWTWTEKLVVIDTLDGDKPIQVTFAP
jgi:hypothetical protein